MKKIYYVTMFCLSGFMTTAHALEPLDTSELLRKCASHEKNPASLDTANCRSYIQGYFGGAFAMRTINVADLPKKRSDFAERATRNRTGNMDIRFGMNDRAGYCVPQDLTISEFVVRLNRFATVESKHSELANQFLLEFLRKEFVCNAEKN